MSFKYPGALTNSLSHVSLHIAQGEIEISFQRYVIEALSAMTLGLFASLLIGLIIKTIGSQTMVLFGDNAVSAFLVEMGLYLWV